MVCDQGTLIMYGAHEEELMRPAVFWAGKTTRTQQSYDHNLDGKTTARQFGNAVEPVLPAGLPPR
jgi:type IV secretion system protein VirD4